MKERWDMNYMFIILIVVMILTGVQVQTYQIVYFKYVQFISYQLGLN
jgi:hypothetical protein